MKEEFSFECEKCGAYNLSDGVVEKGNVYCNECFKKIMEQRRKWRLAKKYKIIKFPIKLTQKTGKVLTIYGTKIVKRK